MTAWWSGDTEAFQHRFDAAERKGQHWQGDTGSVCGSLFTPLQAVIICYNLMSVVWPVMGNIYPCMSSLACKSRSGKKSVNVLTKTLYHTQDWVVEFWDTWPVSRWLCPQNRIHWHWSKETQYQNTTRPCHSTHEFQLFSRLGGANFFTYFTYKCLLTFVSQNFWIIARSEHSLTWGLLLLEYSTNTLHFILLIVCLK